MIRRVLRLGSWPAGSGVGAGEAVAGRSGEVERKVEAEVRGVFEGVRIGYPDERVLVGWWSNFLSSPALLATAVEDVDNAKVITVGVGFEDGDPEWMVVNGLKGIEMDRTGLISLGSSSLRSSTRFLPSFVVTTDGNGKDGS